MKIRKLSLGFFSIIFVVFFVGFGWHFFHSGFRLQKIAFVIPEKEQWKSSVSEEEMSRIKEVLEQPFFYLDKGRQSYVFSSRDGKYVLKLFRYHLVKKRFSLYVLRYLKFWDPKKKQRLFNKKKQLQSWMESYHLAFERLKEETGLLYMHLVKTEGLPKARIKDGLGRSFTLDLNTCGFLLQKKTSLFSSVVKNLVAEKKRDLLRQVMKAYFKTVASRHQKGIVNKDHSWIKNYGIIGFSEAVEIDVGRYSVVSAAKTRKKLAFDLYSYTSPLRCYLEKNYPEIMQDYQEVLEEEVAKWFPS